MQIEYKEFPKDIPVIIEDSGFLYPFMISPLFLDNQKDIDSVILALNENLPILILTSKENREGYRDFDNSYDVGVIGSIMRKVVLPDGRVKILFQGQDKGRIVEVVDKNRMIAKVDLIETIETNEEDTKALISIIEEKVKELIKVSNSIPIDILKIIEDYKEEPNRIIDLIISSIKLKKEENYKIFKEEILENKLLLLIEYLTKEIEINKLQTEIRSKVHSKMDKMNREYFLKEQLREIQKELGTSENGIVNQELEEYKRKLKAKKKYMPKEAIKEIEKQLNKFAKIHPESADANMLQNYLDSVLDIPFGVYAKKEPDISEVERQLNSDHYSLTKPKERITEFFAVRKLLSLRGIKSREGKGAILCFVGPPGVGKTSLANSIATALKRKLVRIALGGIEDVNELRGHRRTYIGAMVGRIVQGLIEAKEMDPVIVLDEIDKVGRSHRGDPTAVLLEILDPEQNSNFRDLFLNFHIDLSRVIFIATANDISQIPAPLRDRMEFIWINSYTPQEKFQIATKYLIPQEIKKHGLKRSEVTFSKGAVEKIISNYTREAGVRNLRRAIAKIIRKVVYEILQNGVNRVSITIRNLSKYLEKEIFEVEERDKESQIGIVNGLAWTSVGGDVLKVEAIKIEGKGEMILTGSMGDVMKESAKIAQSVVKVLIDNKIVKGVEKGIYNRYNIHLHIPEGATPKDGPSAGIAMATAITSILSDKKVKNSVAMTGELTLTGKVLPIGGLKEKLIAAFKAKIEIVIIPEKNYQKDLDDIPDEVKEALNIVGVKRIEEVLEIALEE